MRYGILASLLLIPSLCHAAVMLSEIAWMGTTVGPNEEWIELYNHGSEAVTVDGWTLAGNDSLMIALSGTIPGNSFVLLERSDDDTVPGVTAFLTYTGALTNTGTTLTLRNSEGTLVDQVVGGENWQNIGGDNATKQTPQRTTTSWVTGTPTPGAANVAHEQPASQSEDEEAPPSGVVKGVTTIQKKDGPGERVSLTPSTNKLELSVISPDILYVNQSVSFTASASGVGESIQNSLKYAWNFGDTYTASGKMTTHSYAYPGTYVVALNATYARHDVTVYKTIEVLPVTLALSRTERGDVMIQNTGDHDIDLSGYVLKGTKKIVFPKNTILLRNGTITVDRDRLEAPFAHGNLVIVNTESVMVASETSNPSQLAAAPPTKVTRAPTVPYLASPIRTTTEPLVLGASDSTVEGENNGLKATTTEEARIIPVYAQEESQNGTPKDHTQMLTYLGLIGVLVTSILFLYKR